MIISAQNNHFVGINGGASLFVLMCIAIVFLASMRGTHAGEVIPWDGGVADSFAGGDGTAASPYQIETAAQLALVASKTNDPAAPMPETYCELRGDIDLGSREWIPIGKGAVRRPKGAGEETVHRRFIGGFNGNGHTVSNFRLTALNTPDIREDEYGEALYGLFGEVGEALPESRALSHYIRDLHIGNMVVKLALDNRKHAIIVGGLLAKGGDTKIERCSVRGLVEIETQTGGRIEAGMLAGTLKDCGLFDSRAAGRITCRRECDFIDDVVGSPSVGGLAASNRSSGSYFKLLSAKPDDEAPFTEFGWIRGCEVDVDVDVETEQFIGRVPVVHVPLGMQTMSFTGGLTAWNDGAILRCTVKGDVRSVYRRTRVAPTKQNIDAATILYVGGLAGHNQGRGVAYCLSTGSVQTEMKTEVGISNIKAGGLIGVDRSEYSIGNQASGAVTVQVGSTGGSFTEAIAGGLVGTSSGGQVTGCSASGKVLALSDSAGALRADATAGGLMGQRFGGAVNDCYAEGDVVADASSIFRDYLLRMDYTLFHTISTAGGLIGAAMGGGTIASCHATGNVEAGNRPAAASKMAYAGGLIGGNFVTAEDCYATGDVAVRANSTAGRVYGYAGGLIGYNNARGRQPRGYDEQGLVARCHASGLATVDCAAKDQVAQRAGGLTGIARGVTDNIRDSFWLVRDTDPEYEGIGVELNVEGELLAMKTTRNESLTPSEFRDREIFVAKGWDFDAVWTYPPDSDTSFPIHYPRERLNPAFDKLVNQRDFYAHATPELVGKLLAGISLKGVSAADGNDSALAPLMRAAASTPYPEVIDLLVAAGCDVNGPARLPWKKGETSTHRDTVRTPLHYAARNINPEVLKRLLSYSPDLRAAGGPPGAYSPLHVAAEKPTNTEQFVTLLRAGVEPDGAALDLWRQFTGRGGLWEPYAGVWWKPEDVAKMTRALLDAGAVPDTEILVRMLTTGESEAAMMLLQAGVDAKGDRVLEAAFTRPKKDDDKRNLPPPAPELVSLLIARNDVNASFTLDGEELTPLRAACRAAMPVNVVQLLVEAGAELDPVSDAAQRARPGYVPNNIPIRDLVEGGRDNPELLHYLLNQGLAAFSYLDWEPLAILASPNAPRPEMARILADAGADARVLRNDRFDHRFAVEAGLLDENLDPIIDGKMSAGTAKRLAFEKSLILEWALANPKHALIDRRFYACATADDVRRVLDSRPSKKKSPSGIDIGTPSGMGVGRGVFHPSRFALPEAAYRSPYPEVIEILVKAGHRVNDDALEMAFANVNPEVAAAVLHRAKDLSPLLKNMNWTGIAHPSLVPVLREAGMDLDAGKPTSRRKKVESSLLVEVARRGNTPFVRALVRAGVDLNKEDREGVRALDHVIDDGYFELALEMLDAGAECGYVNEFGRTPLLRAARHSPQEPEKKEQLQRLRRRLEKECPAP